VKKYDKYLVALEDDESIPLEEIQPYQEEIINKLETERLKLAYMIGWTFNISGYRELEQSYYVCETCEYYEGEEVIVWYPCAMYCHYGHYLTTGNKGKRKKTVCSCGTNTFKYAPRNEAYDHPLKLIADGEPMGKLYFNKYALISII
jgi:hypothetical protein